jgi:NitT/TauT family transport system substrate-binding protein
MSSMNFPTRLLLKAVKRMAVPCLGLLFLIANGGQADGGGLKKASLIPQWVPQAQFAGYYVAKERGIYEKHGIDLTIIPGGPGRQPSDYLANGQAQFATMWLASGLEMRASGKRVVNIAQMMQRSALMLVAKQSSGIREPQDMNGKKVGLWGPIFQIQPKAFFEKYDLKVRIVRQSYSVDLFLRDGVDVASAMWYNEYHTLLNSGLDPRELVTFFFHDHGLNFPEDGIYALEDTFLEDPDLCRSFVSASIKGWRYAFSHPETALDIVMRNLKREHIPARRVHQRWMLNRIKDLMLWPDSRGPTGILQPLDYLRVAEVLKEHGLIGNIPDFTSFFRKHSAYDEE